VSWVVSRAHILGVDHAAQALGVSRETLASKLDSGELPEAIFRHGKWMLPTDALTEIAQRQQWPLAHKSLEPALLEIPEPIHLPSSPISTQCADTSASTNRRKEDVSNMTDLTTDATTTEQEIVRLSEELGQTDRRLALAERERSITNAKAEELQRQLDQERIEKAALISKIRTLEVDRQAAVQAMNRRSKRRYLRQKSQTKQSAPPSTLPPVRLTTPSDHPPARINRPTSLHTIPSASSS